MNTLKVVIHDNIVELFPFECAVSKIKDKLKEYADEYTQLNAIVAESGGIYYYYFELFPIEYISDYGYTLSYDKHNLAHIYKNQDKIKDVMIEHDILFKVPSSMPTKNRR